MLKVMQKQYQLIELDDTIIRGKVIKYAVKYKNSDHIADYLANKHVNGIYRDNWIDGSNEKPEGYKEISFKKFREIY